MLMCCSGAVVVAGRKEEFGYVDEGLVSALN